MDFYDLPTLVGDQYMLTSVLRETRDTVLYRATQRELRREVIVERLRISSAEHPRRVRLFLDSAKAQARFRGEHLSSVLEVLESDGSWLVVKESPPGEPLDMVHADGKQLSAFDLCRLFVILCHLCLRLDTEHVAATRFHLEDVYYHEHHFRLSNPARAGTRAAEASRSYLAGAAKEIVPMLDAKSHLAGALMQLLQRVQQHRSTSPMCPALFMSEFTALHTLMLREVDSSLAQR